MRVLSVCVLLLAFIALVVAQPDAAAATAVEVVPVPAVVPATPVAVAAAAPVAAAPTAADAAALSAVQRDIESLVRAQAASAAELKTAQASTDAKVAALTQTLEQGLTKLYAADAAQTAADEAQLKNAAAAASSTDSSAAVAAATSAATATQARLESVERELAELKKVLSSFVATQTAANAAAAAAAEKAANVKKAAPTATADPLLVEIKASQALILAQLATATAPYSFDYETIAAQAKNSTIAGATKLSKFAQKSYASFMANYPTYVEQARVAGAAGLVHAEVFRVQAIQVSGEARSKLTEVLLAKGVPKEHVNNVVLGAFGLAVLIGLIITISILRCVCSRCCCRCCCAKSKAQTKLLNKATKLNKNAKPSEEKQH